jgi:protein-arginine kinase activator protein McsA
MMKICEVCQKEFKALTKYKRFCNECYDKRQEEHVKKWVEEHKKPNPKCIICGVEITPGRKNRK